MTTTLSVRRALRGKRVLLTGASGFLGKVWLAMVLEQLPEIGHVYVLLRPGKFASAHARLEHILANNPAFANIHEHHRGAVGAFFAARLTALDGDITEPLLGLSPDRVDALGELDLVVHSAGAVDFSPDLGLALDTNVHGALHAAEVADRKGARLIHVSTAYVAGTQQGRIPEVVADKAPNGLALDAEKELRRADGLVARTRKLQQRSGERRPLVEEGTERAERLGFPNTYTYVKSLAERLLVTRYPRLPKVIFRPAIVESAISFPFPGWNEGFNTSGPLAFLLGTWFKFFPSKVGNPFDVIPVDEVCRALTTMAAALIDDVHPEVVHCGSSDRNRFTVDRACELTGLAHRRYYRKEGEGMVERLILPRVDAVSVPPDHVLNMGNLRGAMRLAADGLQALPLGTPKPIERWARDTSRSLRSADKEAKRVDKVLNLFLPFVHDLHFVFTANGLHDVVAEEAEFRFAPEAINWRTYWVDIQVPGLRKWCFPVIRGEKVPTYIPPHPFRLPVNMDALTKSA